jgi:serine/threonine-protein kinase
MAHLTEAATPLHERRAEVPPALSSLIMRLLAKDPADRPQSAEEVLRALDDVPTVSDDRRRATARVAPTIWPVRRSAIVAVLIVSLIVAAISAYRKWIGTRAPNIASLVVLPFVNTSGEAANEPFTEGLTDELIGTLSKVSGLTVMSRSSSFALKGKSLGPRAIAEMLPVGAMIEGSLRREGNRLKVAAQLVSTKDGTIIWTETYDRELIGAFDVQEQIARSIVAALRIKLVAGTDSASSRRPTADTAAYELYLRGRQIFRVRTDEDGSREAARYFEQAIARDSSFARAYSGLSDAHTRLAVFGYAPPDVEFEKGRAAARRALDLDGTLADAHVSLGQILMVHDFKWAESERELRLAASLDRGYTYARTVLAICLASQGRFAERSPISTRPQRSIRSARRSTKCADVSTCIMTSPTRQSECCGERSSSIRN